ncbi:SWIB/MDM2 domain [Ostreococcus tauri]|uniref:SWIB/MDM2 domain n=1 Tax=Ostreococcus tauri TaxID=70448 RepID=A0A090N375_OSTTA|nr:SWIB/MDM2 domain [Ostreococcus tauri]CEF97628.1 SWIB/MDM2 domain [Ostreococcus tauri]|eukprot:XP_022838796.1 SWIB/MDM2 domain [Ostreococcus tauri]
MSARPTHADARQWKRRRANDLDARARRERTREDVRECASANALRSLERELDEAIASRRARARGTSRYERAVRARVRACVFASKTGVDGKGFVLRACGWPADGEAAEPWSSSDGDGRFAQYVKTITITLDGERRPRTWTSDGRPGKDRFDGFEVRGRAESGTREATIRIEFHGDGERYKVARELAELLATPYATRKRVISEIWTYFSVNDLVSDDDASEVVVDQPMREVLVGAGMTVPTDGKLKVVSVCEFVCTNMLSAVEPLEIRYKIDVSGPSPSKPECYDVEVEMMAPAYISTESDPEKSIEQCEAHIRRAYPYIEAHLQRRNFLLRFAESPFDFINSCVRDQALGMYETKAEDLSYVKARDAPERPAPRCSERYHEPWVDEAVMRLL